MKILAADCCTSSGSVALLDGEQVVAEWTFVSPETHNRRLLKTIGFLLNEIGWSLHDVDAYAVTRGPGSFTGLRIGLTTMKTLAWSTGKPFVGVPSLDALAAPLATGSLPICTLLDAKKQELYFGFFLPDGRGQVTLAKPYWLLPVRGVSEHIAAPAIFCGNGCPLYRDTLQSSLGNRFLEAPAPFHLIRASFVGQIALTRLLRGETDDPMTSVPLYVRPSEAELKRPQSARS